MEELEGDEALFYEDQKTVRVGRISTDIDIDYELEIEERLLQEQEKAERDRENFEHAFLDEEATDTDANVFSEVEMNIGMNRSGITRSTVQVLEKSVQTDPVIIDRQKLRENERICSDDAK